MIHAATILNLLYKGEEKADLGIFCVPHNIYEGFYIPVLYLSMSSCFLPWFHPLTA